MKQNFAIFVGNKQAKYVHEQTIASSDSGKHDDLTRERARQAGSPGTSCK